MFAGPLRPGRAQAPTALLAALTVTLLAPMAARADRGRDAVKVAQKYIELGEDLFRLDEYREAAENFVRAAKALQDGDRKVPAALYRTLARCHDQLGEADKAIDYYERFIDRAEVKRRPKAKLRKAIKEAHDAVARLQGMLSRTALDFRVTPKGAEVRLDGEVMGETPLQAIKTTPGPHEVALSKAGHETLELKVEAVAGAVVPVIASLGKAQADADGAPPLPSDDAQTPSEAAPAAQPPAQTSSVVPWSLTGAAVGLGGAAITLMLLASGQEADADERATQANAGNAEAVKADVQEAYDSAGLKRNLALTLGASAAIAGGLATWLWLGSDAAATMPLTLEPRADGLLLLLEL